MRFHHNLFSRIGYESQPQLNDVTVFATAANEDLD